MKKVNGGRLFAKALKKEGVEQVFALAGGHIMPIFYGCRAEGIEVVDCRHECAAAFAADAYAQATGRPGVIITTAGPGITNTITGMVEAGQHGVPIIQIGGAAPVIENDTGGLQEINSLEILSSATKWARKIYHTQRIPDYVSMAFRYALGGTPGPVYLECAADTLYTEINEQRVHYPEFYRSDFQPFGDDMAVKKAAELLVDAKKPVMVIGENARFSATYGEAIAELIDYLKIPTEVMTMSRGLFGDEDNPMFRLGIGALAAADVILMLGVKNDYQIYYAKPPFFNPEAKLIQVNTDSRKIGFNAPAHVGIVGGAGAVARQILEAVKEKVSPREDLFWIEEAGKLTEEIAMPWFEGFTADSKPIHPGRCAAEVAEFLNSEGRDWTLVADGGESMDWIRIAASAHRPGQILTFGSFGTIGVGHGFVIGAWYANRKPILLYTGDGSFGFYSMEFDTFARKQIPVVCVISNDSAWGMIKNAETLVNPHETEKGHVGLKLEYMRHYEKLANLWDGYGELVTEADQIIPAIKRGYASGKPAIINVEVDQKSINPITRMYAEGFSV